MTIKSVLVLPAPLVAGDHDVDVGFFRVVDIDQGLGGGHGHADENQQWDNGPEYFDRDVLVKSRGYCAPGLAVHEHRPEHHTEHDHADDDADPEDGHVQIKY